MATRRRKADTEAPETDVPETDGNETEAPETDVPETDGNETDASETDGNETEEGGDEGRPRWMSRDGRCVFLKIVDGLSVCYCLISFE